MRAFRQNRLAGGGLSLLNRDDPNPDSMKRKLEIFEARLSYQETRTLRAVILAMVLGALAVVLVVAHILAS